MEPTLEDGRNIRDAAEHEYPVLLLTWHIAVSVSTLYS